MSESYSPYGKCKAILDRAMEHINSVDYQVSVRWVFYRLLQDGLYKTKADYLNFVPLTSRARKSWYDGWRPDLLADETRGMQIFEDGGGSPEVEIEELIEQEVESGRNRISYYKSQIRDYRHVFSYDIDPNYYQDKFCIVMFEARAMLEQFKQYTNGLTLCPFGGQPSIPFKWTIAKHTEERCARYGTPAVILYFSDADDAGHKIYDASMRDIVEWCRSEIETVYCGLTKEQAIKYKVPENFEKPGQFQWEALTDQAAREIITQGISQHYDTSAKGRASRQGGLISRQVNSEVNRILAQENSVGGEQE